MRADSVEQVFVRRRGGGTEVLMVLESPAGERTRETLPLAAPAYDQAVRMAAVHLARRGIVAARRLRLRAERHGQLVDDAELLEVFTRTLEHEGRDASWA